MAQNLAAEGRRSRQSRQGAILREGAQPQDGIVAPVVALAELPESQAVRQHRAVESNRKLQQACEQRLAAGQQRQCLDDADIRVRVHQLRQRHQRLAGHDAVRIEHDHVVVSAAPVAHELGDIAGFSPDIVAAPAVEQTAGGAASCHQRRPGRDLCTGNLAIARIGQDVEIEALLGRLLLQRPPYGICGGEHSNRIFIVDRYDDRGLAC